MKELANMLSTSTTTFGIFRGTSCRERLKGSVPLLLLICLWCGL